MASSLGGGKDWPAETDSKNKEEKFNIFSLNIFYKIAKQVYFQYQNCQLSVTPVTFEGVVKVLTKVLGMNIR